MSNTTQGLSVPKHLFVASTHRQSFNRFPSSSHLGLSRLGLQAHFGRVLLVYVLKYVFC